jgi:hypothetical protein
MADENDDTDAGGDAGKGGSSGGGGSKSGIMAVIEALREIGMNIPEEVTDEAGLVIAIKAGGAPAGGDSDLDPDLDLDADTSAGGATAGAGSPPMLMSATDRDPGVRQRVVAWAREERRDATARIRNLFKTGRIDRPTATKLNRQLQATEMSFNAEADAVYPLARKLAELEKLPADSAWKADGRRDATEMSATRGIDAPAGLNATRDAEEAKVVAEQAELAKKFSPKQAAAKK